jgi:uncharacterized protein YdeI (YjbR/CyaY-like superfamily)
MGKTWDKGGSMTAPRRPRHAMPDDVAAALADNCLEDAYEARPPYQRNDYIGWITQAKRESTRQARIAQMLDELRAGDVYMRMEWQAGRPKAPHAASTAARPPRRPAAIKPRAADLEFVELPDRGSWRSWLVANGDSSPGVWLAVGKKGGSVTELTYDDAVEEALCFGWIDSTTRALDADRFQQLFTPRKPGGTWARSNKERVERLTHAGLMTPAGLARIEEAKADGSWTLIDEVEALEMPEDLATAFDAVPRAARGFRALPDSKKKQLLYWIRTAKRESTRANRIAETVSALEEGRWPR